MEHAVFSWQQFVNWVFYGLFALFGVFFSSFLSDIKESMKEMSTSIGHLNENVATVITASQYQQKSLDNMNIRVERLEANCTKN